MQSSQKLRELLPGVRSGSSPPRSLSPIAKKRSAVRTACENCRQKKAACDDGRPSCLECRKKNLVCIRKDWTTSSKKSGVEAMEVLRLLKSLPDDESYDLLQRLRTDADSHVQFSSSSSSSLLRSQDTSSIGLPPGISSPLTFVQPSQNSLGFELMIRHPIAYPVLLPVEPAYSDPPGHSRPYQRRNLSTIPSESNLPLIETSTRAGSFEKPVDANSLQPSIYCDARLDQTRIRAWTEVMVSDEFTARVISLYLETDHPLLGFFDADLFLDDFVLNKPNFCSSILVNALMAWACQAYSAFEHEAAAASQLFYLEACHHWQQAKDRNTLTAIAGLHFLSLAAGGYGKDREARQYLHEGISMGERMGLFGAPTEAASARAWLDHHEDWVRAASHTAWGAFCWATKQHFHFQTGWIAYPPRLPIPGEMTHRLPRYMGRTFQYYCNFSAVIKDFIWEYYGGEGIGSGQRATLAFVEKTYHALLTWADSLPSSMARGDESPHHTIVLHIDYHAVILDLFRPFIHKPGHDPVQLTSFSALQSTADSVYAASVNQFKHLTLTYRKTYPEASYSIMWHNSALYLANAMLHEVRLQPSNLHVGSSRRSSSSAVTSSSSEWQFYLQLCLASYTDLYVSYPVAALIARGLLSMALRDDAITSSQVSAVIRRLDRNGRNHGIAVSETRASFIADLDLAVTDPLAAQVEVLADHFDELAIPPRFASMSTDESYWQSQSRETSRLGHAEGDEERAFDDFSGSTTRGAEDGQRR